MSFASYRLPASLLGMGPALLLLAGCSGGGPAENASQASSPATPPAAAAADAAPASRPAAPATKVATIDRYANPAPTTPSPKPAIDFDGDVFRAAAANQTVVGDRYSR